MPRPKTWRVLDLGEVPEDSPRHPYDCKNCGTEALLPMVGTPIARFSWGGIVFDRGGFLPLEIQCRTCRTAFISGPKRDWELEDVR